MCVNQFARTHGIKFDKKQGKARTGTGEVADLQVILARPQTYMNRSGEAVRLLVKKYSIDLNDLLIIYDEIDLPLGKLRIRPGGSSAGHKGMESIIAELGTQEFPRLRVGIGHPATLTDSSELSESGVIDWMLRPFTAEERQVINQVIPRVSEAILCILTEGLTSAMNEFN
jgi:PTH1 family peptidyl-tRNA hydrolase